MDNMMKKLICVLVLAVAIMTASAQTKLKIFNYNVRMSGQMVNYSAKPFAELIKQQNPDFVMLQEVDFNTTRNGNKDFLTELAAELGMFPAFGKAIDYQNGEYGVGILSKYPIEKISNNQLTSSRSDLKEKRTVLYIDVNVDGQKLRIASTHLDHSTAEVRLDMVNQMNSYVSSGGIPVILAGDFNAYPTEQTITGGMSSWQKICDNLPTISASNPTSKIDYIFARPLNGWTVVSYKRIIRTDLSDHVALVAEVELK